MRLAYLFALAMAGCVVPAQQPTYYQGQPPPNGQAQQAPPAPVAAASCTDTLDCYGACDPMTEACVGACDQRTTPESSQDAHAVLQCMATSGCQDQNCVAQQCGAQVTTCTNLTLAAAPTAPTAPAGGNRCDAVMQPEYNSVNAQYIPKVTCALTQADLAGDWQSGSGVGTAYYDSSGTYVGASTISTATHRIVDAKGNYGEDWKGATSTSGAATAHGMGEHTTGTITLGANNVVLITSNPNEYHRDTYRKYYIVAGWFADANQITMSLVGPYSDPPTAEELQNASSTSYNHDDYHRSR
jgi:hypothetical protein